MGWDQLPSMGAGWGLPGSGDGNDGDDDQKIQWQRKTPWVGLAFATMAMPTLVCLAGLRRGGRQSYRHSLTTTQKSEHAALALYSHLLTIICSLP